MHAERRWSVARSSHKCCRQHRRSDASRSRQQIQQLHWGISSSGTLRTSWQQRAGWVGKSWCLMMISVMVGLPGSYRHDILPWLTLNTNAQCISISTLWAIKTVPLCFFIITQAFLGRFLNCLYHWKQEGIPYKAADKIYHFTLTVSLHSP